jgi:hypothetical protein
MDLRVYYKNIRDVESGISEEFPLMVSVETQSGGKPGVKTEVPRRLAAKMIVEGHARLATAEEKRAHMESIAEARRIAEQLAASTRLQLSVLSAAELEQLKADSRKRSKD